LLAAMPKRY